MSAPDQILALPSAETDHRFVPVADTPLTVDDDQRGRNVVDEVVMETAGEGDVGSDHLWFEDVCVVGHDSIIVRAAGFVGSFCWYVDYIGQYRKQRVHPGLLRDNRRSDGAVQPGSGRPDPASDVDVAEQCRLVAHDSVDAEIEETFDLGSVVHRPHVDGDAAAMGGGDEPLVDHGDRTG